MNLFGRSEKYKIPSVSERFLRARIYHKLHKLLIIKTIFARKIIILRAYYAHAYIKHCEYSYISLVTYR